jgi:hypothetical protein
MYNACLKCYVLINLFIEWKKRKKGKNKQSKNNIKWRKITPAEVDAKFEGPHFPDPPVHDLFGHELIETISEQTD